MFQHLALSSYALTCALLKDAYLGGTYGAWRQAAMMWRHEKAVTKLERKAQTSCTVADTAVAEARGSESGPKRRDRRSWLRPWL